MENEEKSRGMKKLQHAFLFTRSSRSGFHRMIRQVTHYTLWPISKTGSRAE